MGNQFTETCNCYEGIEQMINEGGQNYQPIWAEEFLRRLEKQNAEEK